MNVTTFDPAAQPAPGLRAANPGASGFATARAVAVRTARKFVRSPQLIVIGTIQGAMFLLIFRYVFGGAIDVGGLPYVDFLVPGFIVTGVLFAGAGAAAGVAEDVEQGFFDRLRSLPIPRLAVLTGRAVADTSLLAWTLAVTVAIGFAVGFRLHGDPGAAIAAFALCLAYGFAFGWVFIFIGLIAGNAQAAQGMSLLVFPLTFVSSAYVPVASMPSWLRVFAEHQPITAMVDAVRSLTLGPAGHALLGSSTTHDVVVSLVWCAVLVGVFAPLSALRYARTR
jgi:ABC transporter DrrB family efflux protein